jgi:hypothetical protein
VNDVDTEWLRLNRDKLYAAAFHIYCQNLKRLPYHENIEHGYDPLVLHDDDYNTLEERINSNCHWWFSEKHEPILYVMLSHLSLRTLVRVSWQDGLNYYIAFHVGQKVATRVLKEMLGQYAKVTEDQIGRYMASKGIHTKCDKVSYTLISQNEMKPPMRLAGWLIGGDIQETLRAV